MGDASLPLSGVPPLKLTLNLLQAMATLGGIRLSKAALSHKVVPRRRHVSQLLPESLATEPLLEIPAAYQSPEALQSLQHAGAVKGAGT